MEEVMKNLEELETLINDEVHQHVEYGLYCELIGYVHSIQGFLEDATNSVNK